ncbi:flagellar hook-length control protein FliK [Geomonas sp. Red32]|uniref:flagellar hook-length control protein FliK n=1 Tax=Geomonas sp. Red32 TaxID=2912856 RepID=UPI00202CFB9A|nr:flagellar hook-length control protein FliK [Geomonas sp. Red32]MCM0081062.1 flagellar hook-length control protein FliK [Geomonas sp. Red32]
MFQPTAPMPMTPAAGNLTSSPAPGSGPESFAGVLQGAQASLDHGTGTAAGGTPSGASAHSAGAAASATVPPAGSEQAGAAPEGASSARTAVSGQAPGTAKPPAAAGANAPQTVAANQDGQTAAVSTAAAGPDGSTSPASSSHDGQDEEAATDGDKDSANTQSTAQSPLWSFAPSQLAMAGAMAAQGNQQPVAAAPASQQEPAQTAVTTAAGIAAGEQTASTPGAVGSTTTAATQVAVTSAQTAVLNDGTGITVVTPGADAALPAAVSTPQGGAVNQAQGGQPAAQPQGVSVQTVPSGPVPAASASPAQPAGGAQSPVTTTSFQPTQVVASSFQPAGIANAAAAPVQGSGEGQVKVKQQQQAELDGMTAAGANQKGAQADNDSVGGVEGDHRQPTAQAGATTQNGGTQTASTPVANNQANAPSPAAAPPAQPATIPGQAGTSNAAASNAAPAQAATPATGQQGQNVNASAPQPAPVTTVAAQTAAPLQGAVTGNDPMATFVQGQTVDSRQEEGSAGSSDRRATATDSHVRSLFAEKPAGQPAQATTVASSEATGTKPAVQTQAGSPGVPQGAAEQKASGDGQHQSGFQKEQYRPQDQFFNVGLNAPQNQPAAQPAPTDSSAHLKSLEQSIMAQVKDGVVTHDAKGNGQITVRLNPDELGELKIQVRMVDNTVKVEVQADNKMVKDLLMGNLDNLKQALAGKNFTMEGFNVSTGNGGFNGSLADQGNSQQQSTPRYLRNAGYADAAPGKVNYVTEETDNLVSVRL